MRNAGLCPIFRWPEAASGTVCHPHQLSSNADCFFATASKLISFSDYFLAVFDF